MKDLILSIDCGTQSLRTLLFDFNGHTVDAAKIQYEKPYESPRPGWAEQDAALYWRSFLDAFKMVRERNEKLPERIAGVTVTTQRDTMVNVDADGHPLRPAIMWLDQRKASGIRKRDLWMKFSHKLVGMDESVKILESESRVNWIRANQPEIWAKTHKYLQVSGFLNFKLTGRFVDSTASQIGHIPFDYKNGRWAQPNDIKSILFYVEREKLCDLAEPSEAIGGVTKEASEQTGLLEGTPVISSGSDKGCETIGMGCLDDKKANLSLGTTATIQVTSRKYFEPIRFMPAYPAPVPGFFNPEVEIFRGFWMITWFKNEFGINEVIEAEKRGMLHEEVLDEMLRDVPPGSMGLIAQPYWGPGLKTPEAKGSLIGFGDVHGRAHMYRAIIEGIGYALLEGLRGIERRGRIKVERLTISGGGSRSDDVCQITSDIFNLPVYRGETSEAAGLGAAVSAAVGLGIHGGYGEAVGKMVRYSKAFSPNPENSRIYEKLFEKVYMKMYGRLRPLYRKIREITGYPENVD